MRPGLLSLALSRLGSVAAVLLHPLETKIDDDGYPRTDPEDPTSWYMWQDVDEMILGAEVNLTAIKAIMPGNRTRPEDGAQQWYHSIDNDDPVKVSCIGKEQKVEKAYGWILHNVSTPRLMPFLVPLDAPNRKDAALVVVPGGGGQMVAWENEGTDIAIWLNSLGYSAFVLKYRVPSAAYVPETNLIDAQRAMSLVRYRAGDFQLNATRIGMFAASHGGTIALLASASVKRFYDPIDAADYSPFRPDFLLLIYPAPPQGVDQRFFPLAFLPPTFIAAATDDKCVPTNRVVSFYRALHATGANTSELHIFPNGKHGFSLCFRQGLEEMKHTSACEWTTMAAQFMEITSLDHGPPEMSELYRQRTQILEGGAGATAVLPALLALLLALQGGLHS